MEISLHGKTAVITGASGQLGRVTARTLAASGANIVVHYIKNKDTADSLVAEIEKIGRRAIAVQADITKEADVNRMRDIAFETLGDVHIVVNNAVIQYEWTTILEQPLADFQSQFDSCIMQSVLTAKAFMPEMIKRKSGRFIGISTECAQLCKAGIGAYSAAKRGMDGLYRVLAKEVGEHGINVTQVAPGWTISDNTRKEGSEISPDYTADVPLGRRGTDKEISDAVLFLASDMASFITGVNLPVSGGVVMV
ncbi:MAG: SDR family oxidoreductase [Defluviitaleaceae bacterium]|nr:SDR family oxidoreductase [Defluviitaleaceae bacterium]